MAVAKLKLVSVSKKERVERAYQKVDQTDCVSSRKEMKNEEYG